MARTTLDIEAPVLRELKARQQREGKTLGALVSELLSAALATAPPEPGPFRWTAKAMGEPLIDLDDKDALWAVLDER